MKGKKLKIITNDGKELKIPGEIVKKLIIYGGIEIVVKDNKKVKEILFVPEKLI